MKKIYEKRPSSQLLSGLGVAILAAGAILYVFEQASVSEQLGQIGLVLLLFAVFSKR